MTKFIQAINAMITNADKINEVYKGIHGEEYFFLYKEKYMWSIRKSEEGDYFMYYYVASISIRALSSLTEWGNIPMMAYSTKEYATKEAFQSFQELYGIVKGKVLGIDKVLDDIILDL